MSRANNKNILIVDNTLDGKIVDDAGRADRDTLIWDDPNDKYIHAAIDPATGVPYSGAITDVDLGTRQLKSGTAKIGGAANYTEFEADGTMKMAGDATTWQDIDFPIIIRATGTNIPTMQTLNGNLTMPRWAVNDFNVCESQEFVHQWKEESTVYWHIHLTTSVLDASDRYVRFSIEYGYVTPGGVWVFPVNIDSGDLLIPANTPNKTMFIMSLGSFTPQVGTKIAGHCVARLTRVAASGTAPSVDPFVPMLQQHIECDTVGSRGRISK